MQFWSAGLLQLYGIQVIIQNNNCNLPTKSDDNAILMFSHGSNLDAPILQSTYPYFLHFVGKKELFRVPVLGQYLKAIGQIPIDRENLSAAVKSLNDTGEMIRNEQKSVAIAPEGTRRRSKSGGPDQIQGFKKGPFHLAKACERDIIPVIIEGAYRMWPPGQFCPRAGTVVVKYLERIPKEKIKEASLQEVQEMVKERFQENLELIDDRVIFFDGE